MTQEELKQTLVDRGMDEVVLFEAPAYSQAFIGLSHDNRAIYDYDKMVQCLVDEDGMTEEDAEDFIAYNAVRSLPYQPNSPIILYPIED